MWVSSVVHFLQDFLLLNFTPNALRTSLVVNLPYWSDPLRQCKALVNIYWNVKIEHKHLVKRTISPIISKDGIFFLKKSCRIQWRPAVSFFEGWKKLLVSVSIQARVWVQYTRLDFKWLSILDGKAFFSGRTSRTGDFFFVMICESAAQDGKILNTFVECRLLIQENSIIRSFELETKYIKVTNYRYFLSCLEN